jgi:RNA polymerase-interacting CarD/CdnL/TRCF family regulator
MKNRLDDKELKIATEIIRKECFMRKLFDWANAESEQVSTKEIYNEASRILWENSTFDLTVREETIKEFINPRNPYNITGQS